jgi:hypothetical protein
VVAFILTVIIIAGAVITKLIKNKKSGHNSF